MVKDLNVLKNQLLSCGLVVVLWFCANGYGPSWDIDGFLWGRRLLVLSAQV